MTIALGLIAEDSVVIATDTEESIPGYMKINQYKTIGGGSGLGGQDANCLFAGAGNSSYIDTVSWALLESFFEEGREKNSSPRTAITRFEKVVKTFYAEHVLPFASYPSAERPDFDLLVALCSLDRHQLFAIEKSAMRQVLDYEAIGSGAMFARMLLSQFSFRASMSSKTAELLAAYVVFRVKETIDGCGKHTFIQRVTQKTIEHRSDEQVAEWEKLFQRHDRMSAQALLYAFGHDTNPEPYKKLRGDFYRSVRAKSRSKDE